VLGILDFKKLFANASHTVLILTFKNATLLANMYNVSYMFVDERRFTQRVKKNKKKKCANSVVWFGHRRILRRTILRMPYFFATHQMLTGKVLIQINKSPVFRIRIDFMLIRIQAFCYVNPDPGSM
jgi:hypothetical protein